MSFNKLMSINSNFNNRFIGNNANAGNNIKSNFAADTQSLQRYAYPPQAGSCLRSDSELKDSQLTHVSTVAHTTAVPSADHTIIRTLQPRSHNFAARECVKSFREYSEEVPIESELLQPLPNNILVGTAATDGIGLSTLLSMLARYISKRNYHVALVDADLTHGGLDVLLGLESDEGRRLQEVDAPLGRCDGYVLCNELLHWDDVDVLAFAPWHGVKPDPWVVEAAIRGLAQACDVVIVDIGAGEVAMQLYKNIPQLANAATLAGVELSVLDLARFRAYMQRFENLRNPELLYNKFATVGLAPRGLSPKSYVLNVDEAEEYLTIKMLGELAYDSRLYADIIGGYGIRNIPSLMGKTMKKLEHWLFGEAISRTKDAVTKYRHSQYSHFQNIRGKYGK